MRSLALETSGKVGSIALVENGTLLDERTFPHGLRHAAGLLPLIDAACRPLGWSPTDIGRIDVSIGPGSFTGLRIGVTLAKTLAWGTGAAVVAVPTLRVLAENAPVNATNLIVVLDAKRGQIFTGRFARPSADHPWQVTEPAHVDTVAAMLARAPRPVHLLGEGLPYHAVPADTSIYVTPPETWRARASVVALLAADLAAAGQYADVMRLAPIYIRKPEAEEKADAAEGR